MGQVPGSTTSATQVSNGTAFDDIAGQIIEFATTLYEQWTWDDWYPLVAAVLVLLGLVPIAFLLAVILLAKVGLTLVLVLGPVFIALYLFRPTQSFTSAWVSALVNFVALQVLSVTFITLLMSILTGFVRDAQSQSGGAQLVAAFSIIVIFALALVLALYLPAISSQLAGGGFQVGAGVIHAGVSGSRATATAFRQGRQDAVKWGRNECDWRPIRRQHRKGMIMPSVVRVLTLSATLSVALSACASIETKDLPKCSGQDRRPLNGDLWQWNETQPSAPLEGEPLRFAAASRRPASMDVISGVVARGGAPRWNIAASEQDCR